MPDSVLTVTDEAVEAILGIRAQEPDADQLALTVGITGVKGIEFAYELTFMPLDDATEGDRVERFGELPVIIRSDSVENLTGATIQVGEGGLGIDNPNSPVPKIDPGGEMADGPVADRVRAVLEQQINPAIAGHGGMAQLVGIEGDTAYLRLGGGCQGCGLAAVTLGQGIEVAITNAVPEISKVVDVTDHASGENPYYEAAKK